MSSSNASEDPMEKHTNNAYSTYICPLCKMLLQNPAQLPCGHGYCMSCVLWLLRNILDPECLICGKKIVINDAIFNFGSDDPLLLNLTRWEHSFPKRFVPHSLALGFQHPICDADVQHAVTRFVFLAEFQGRCWELVCDDVLLESHHWQSCQETWPRERTHSIQEFKH